MSPRDIRRIAASCAALVVLIAGAAYWADDQPTTPTSSTSRTP